MISLFMVTAVFVLKHSYTCLVDLGSEIDLGSWPPQTQKLKLPLPTSLAMCMLVTGIHKS